MNLRRSIASFGNGPFAIEAEPTQAHEILSQEAFLRVISLERRRTERSRKPLLLMLMNMGDHSPSDTNRKNLSTLLAALSVSTRETDVAGWYESDRTVGIMFTEICAEEHKTIVSTMISRLSDILRDHLSLEQFNRVGFSFHLFPEDWEQKSRKPPSNPVFYPDLTKRTDKRRVSGAMKRAMDIVGSALALILLAPLFLLIAAVVRATSKGPVFFRQERLGQHGEPFTFLKFRSMHVGNDASVHKEYVKQLISGTAARQHSNGNGKGVFKLTEDSRVNRVGAFLRKTSLDELPQFYNVLKGEMSLVGPRPPIPYEVENYDVWHRRRLLEAKPGITGLWQVSGRSRVTFDEMVRLDLRYARAWSPWMDIKILLRTPFAVFLGEGAH
ncbi:MAG TPA: sugar transferase [Candidatus Dormibacteraeota bacterium]|nr:sugar transferase [Candidatus Dormibacteraeota bacterium]